MKERRRIVSFSFGYSNMRDGQAGLDTFAQVARLDSIMQDSGAEGYGKWFVSCPNISRPVCG